MFTFVFPPATVHGAYSRFYDLVLESNQNARNAGIDPSLYLEMDDAEMQALSDQIVEGIAEDYEKVQAIHDWTCKNIYYDYDAYTNSLGGMEVGSIEEAIAIDRMSAYEFLTTYKRGVCRYYSKIFSELVRAQGIPCMTVYGYAENSEYSSQASGGYLVDRVEQKIYSAGDRWTEENYNKPENHAWNEAYVDGRWIIVDTTWDSQNQYRDKRYIPGSVRQSYFDISEQNLAKDHRITAHGLGESPQNDPTPTNAWLYESGIWYYFRNSGMMVSSGWHRLRGQWYYFYGSGAMAANTTIGGYRVGADGAWVK